MSAAKSRKITVPRTIQRTVIENLTVKKIPSAVILSPCRFFCNQFYSKFFHYLLIFERFFGIIKRFLRIGDLHEYRSQLQKQEKVANALITAEDQSKAIVESARQEAINEKNRIEALIEAEKEKLLDIKKEVIELKERTISVLEKYNSTMSDLLE